jgi:hypothetical protein
MLFKEEGGNLTVQTMLDSLNSHDTELFFKQMRISLQKLIVGMTSLACSMTEPSDEMEAKACERL